MQENFGLIFRSLLQGAAQRGAQFYFFQASKESTKTNFSGPETARLESLSSLGFDEKNLGCPGNFAGMSRTLDGVQKDFEVCATKKWVGLFTARPFLRTVGLGRLR